MKIGILGGSFDPIHKGHIHMAEEAFKQMKLDKIWLMPAGHSPNKIESNMGQSLDRLAMCQLVAEEYDYIEVTDIEVKSDEISYTYLTLGKLTKLYPEHEFFFIMGADSLDYFDKWRHPEIISKYSHILVINRDAFSIQALEDKIKAINMLFPANISIVNCDKVDISSSEIRALIKEEKAFDHLVLPSIANYIKEHQLYK